MIVNVGLRRFSGAGPRKKLGRLLLSDGATVANYQLGIGLTGSTNASAWANQIGVAGPLLQATGANQPAIQGDGSLLFNGTAHYLKTGAFTLNQPISYYLVLNQTTWTDGDYIFDGVTTASVTLLQAGLTPNIQGYAGANGGDNTGLVIGVNSLVTVIVKGAGSSTQIDANAPATWSSGANNAGAFTLGAAGGAVNFSNIQVKEVIIRNVADTAATQAQIRSYLKAIHGTP